MAENSARVARTFSDGSLRNFVDNMLKLNNSFPVDFGNDFLKNLFAKSFFNSGLKFFPLKQSFHLYRRVYLRKL